MILKHDDLLHITDESMYYFCYLILHY